MNACFKIVAAGMLAAALPAVAGIQVDGVAAYANAHVITYSDVLGASRELQQMAATQRGGDEANALFRRVLDELINRKLMLDAYADQREIQIPDSVVDERVEGVVREMFRDDRAAFLKALGEDGHSEAAWRAQIREQMVVGAMRNLRVDSQVRISPLAVRERYEQNPALFDEPAQVKFSMIVIAKGETAEARAAQKEKLESALAALAGGADFADVARRFSEDALAENGGERNWIEPDMLRRELRDLVEQSAPGVVSEVIEIGPHYSIVKVLDRRESGRTSYEDAYMRIERELRQEMAQRIYEDWISRLRRDAFVRVLSENPF